MFSNGFRTVRDSLVAHSKLKPPQKDIEEYKDIIKDSILSDKDGKWFTRKEFDKEELGIKFRWNSQIELSIAF